MKKVLVVVISAAVDPWLAIESRAQKPVFRSLFGSLSSVVWVSGDPELSRNEVVETLEKTFLEKIVPRSLPNSFVSRGRRLLWSLRRGSGLDEEKLRDFFKNFSDSQPRVENHRVFLPLPIPLSLAGLRVVETFRYLMGSYDFDYLLRITSTCLVNPKALERFVENLPLEQVVAGQLLRYGFTKFYSGAAILLSRDVVANVVENQHLYPLNVWEDVGLGTLIRRLGKVNFLTLPRVDIAEAQNVGLLSDAYLEETVIFRCKNLQSGTRADSVVAVMVALEDRLSR